MRARKCSRIFSRGIDLRMIDVVQFQRRPSSGAFSVERLFADVRAELPPDFSVKLRVNRYPSRGVLQRVADAILAARQQGDVNHILGDVHYLAWFLARKRTILTVLDCVSLERMTGLRRWLFWLLWYRLPLRRAAQVTVISEYSRTALLRWVRYPADRIHVIHPPLSREFRRAPAPAPGSCPRLLQVGTTENKNLARVIKAVHGLPVTLVIIGILQDADRVTLEQHGVAFENHVDLDRSELLEQYRRATLLIFASTYEGFGLPIIEAQAVGRPVVTSALCAMPEAAGDAACLVDPYDVADIRRGIRRLLEDAHYAEELVQRGYRNAQRFAPDRIAAQYAAVYRSITARQESQE